MSRKNKVKRYTSIYNKARRRRSIAFQIIVPITAFVVIALIVYFVAVGVTRYMNRESYTDFESSAPEFSTLSTPSNDDNLSDEQYTTKMEQIIGVEMAANFNSNKSYVTEFIKKAKADGRNAIVVPLKTDDGTILYPTKIFEAKSWGAISNSTVDAQIIAKEIEEAGLTPIARISAFYDQTAPHAKRENSYYQKAQDTTTHLFKDSATGKSVRWLNPYKDITRKYICDIVSEIGTFGYKYVLVDNVAFPDTEFDLNTGTYAEGRSKSEILKTFIKELNDTGVSTIISYDWNVRENSKSSDIVYGGDITDYGIKNQAPVIKMQNNSAQMGNIDNSISSLTEYIKNVSSDILIIPEIYVKKDSLDVIDELKNTDIYSNIILVNN